MRKGDDMDMNWQTMLHEAANASFEKDIEVRSAADNDAYSCVDLPKAKIRELSEKILHLPHQGIVLLFSRYCFRLSPQETEKFFQMKNAKGRFRFYRELLSTSMGLSSEQVISDASLNRACKIAMKDYLRTELKEDAAVSSTGKSRTHIVFRRFGKAVAVAAITIIGQLTEEYISLWMIWKQKKRRDRSRAQSSPLREHLQILFYGNTKALSLFSSLCVIWVIPIMHKEDFIYEEKRNCHIGTNYRSTDDRSCRTRIGGIKCA